MAPQMALSVNLHPHILSLIPFFSASAFDSPVCLYLSLHDYTVFYSFLGRTSSSSQSFYSICNLCGYRDSSMPSKLAYTYKR